MDTVNREKKAAAAAEEAAKRYRRGEIGRGRAEKYFEQAAEAAREIYGASDVEGEIDSLETDPEDIHMDLFDRERGYRQLRKYLETGRIDDWQKDHVLATRPAGIGPAALIADEFDLDYSTVVFHGYGLGEEDMPEDAEPELVEYDMPLIGEILDNALVEVFGENIDGRDIVVAGDLWGSENGQADAILDYTARANSIQRRIMNEGWNVPRTVSIRDRIEVLKDFADSF